MDAKFPCFITTCGYHAPVAAATYNELFKGADLITPSEAAYTRHIYHQYTIRLTNRDHVDAALNQKKIPHAVFYPIPLHLQEAYAAAGKPKGSFPVTERIAGEVISLPMHTELTQEHQRAVAAAVLEAV